MKQYKRMREMQKDVKLPSLNKGDRIGIINDVSVESAPNLSGYSDKAIRIVADILPPVGVNCKPDHIDVHLTPTKLAQIWDSSVEIEC